MELSSSDCPSLQYVCDISSLDPVRDSHLRSERCRRPAHVNQALADCGESAPQDGLGPSHRKGGFQRACGTQAQFGKNLIVCRLLDKTRLQCEDVGQGRRKSVASESVATRDVQRDPGLDSDQCIERNTDV